ncbi:DNA sulfur modification protein DndB [Mycolicibacterium sp. CR10]|uniref:DNA sulfur modification protein DndB n=1 Tax=Mycolicibacterium sp. CR10 TaxID=2562314 RepID=UPI0010BFBB40|nr:DNA sulfur modification protein DndB [Mycolicibacterium sp. CR10]
MSIIATKGTQGAHTYFTATMKWGDLDKDLVFPEDLGDLDEDHQMQRAYAKKRIGELVEYLGENDHFFSALTLVILPRGMKHPAVEGDVRNDADYQFVPFEPERIPVASQRLGELHLSGQVQLFPADGQHRSRAAKQKLNADPEFAKEEVPVVLIPFQDHDQVRQLFADLNLNAKPVTKATGLDFEARDPAVLVIKAAADTVPLFQGNNRINRRSNSLPKSSDAVITLSTLKEGSDDILAALSKNAYLDNGGTTWDKDKTTAIKAFIANTDEAVEALADVWIAITNLFPTQRDEILNKVRTPGDIREDYLFAFGLGQRGLARAAATLIEKSPENWDELLEKAVSEFNWKREAEEWKGNAVIHGVGKDKDGKEFPTYRVNNTGPAIQNLADRIVKKAIPAT